jgi:signal transduction histidine kinase
MSSLLSAAQQSVGAKINEAIAHASVLEGNFTTSIEDAPHLLFYKRLNPDSVFPPAYEICVYPLARYDAWRRSLRWQIGLGGLALLIIGFIASHLIAARLSVLVEKLELISEQNRAERKRAEAALESTSEELQRAARYSADASHQLKSPVTVLRAGLETLLTRDDFKPEVYDELSMLLHQTYRLTGVVDDLLLLARMDAGRLQLESQPVNLGELIEEWLDDLSAMPDSVDLQTEKQLPPDLCIAGERHYTSLIVQNVLENARKYNRPGGKIAISARSDDRLAILTIGNTGRAIPRAAQENLFERFQRGSNHQNISGHGLGLNLARELARLHGGDLRLVRSEEDWTEFEVRFRAAKSVTRSAVA